MTRRPQDVNPSPHSSFKSWKSAMNLFLPFKWAFLFVPVIFATPSTRPFERRSWESVELAQMQVPVLQVKKWKRKPVKKVLETATNLPPLWLGCLPDPTFCLFEQLPLVCVLAMLKLEACFAGAISNECWLDTTAVCYLRMLITFQRVRWSRFTSPFALLINRLSRFLMIMRSVKIINFFRSSPSLTSSIRQIRAYIHTPSDFVMVNGLHYIVE